METAEVKKAPTLREQIEWYLDRINDDRMLKKILAFINRVFVGGRV